MRNTDTATPTTNRNLFDRIAEARRDHGSILSAFEASMERRQRECPLQASAAHRGLGRTWRADNH
ncbi:MAG: hypothetical protein WA962_10625 [Ornithinimicrobium sp.]